jgi:hypothetical protein
MFKIIELINSLDEDEQQPQPSPSEPTRTAKRARLNHALPPSPSPSPSLSPSSTRQRHSSTVSEQPVPLVIAEQQDDRPFVDEDVLIWFAQALNRIE